MSLTTHLSFNLYRMSAWMEQNPTAARALTLGLAAAAALVALLFRHNISWACPNGGGSCGG